MIDLRPRDDDDRAGRRHLIEVHSNLSVGCYCADESYCHRSLLRELLIAEGADVENS